MTALAMPAVEVRAPHVPHAQKAPVLSLVGGPALATKKKKKKHPSPASKTRPPLPRTGEREASRGRRAEAKLIPLAEYYSNARVVLTGALEVDCVETRDIHDRAHNQRDGACRLRPSTELSGGRGGARLRPIPGSKPRKYHPSQMRVLEVEEDGVLRGTSCDSAFDWLYDLQRELEGIPGVGVAHNAQRVENERVMAGAERFAVENEIRLRDIVRPRLKLGRPR